MGVFCYTKTDRGEDFSTADIDDFTGSIDSFGSLSEDGSTLNCEIGDDVRQSCDRSDNAQDSFGDLSDIATSELSSITFKSTNGNGDVFDSVPSNISETDSGSRDECAAEKVGTLFKTANGREVVRVDPKSLTEVADDIVDDVHGGFSKSKKRSSCCDSKECKRVDLRDTHSAQLDNGASQSRRGLGYDKMRDVFKMTLAAFPRENKKWLYIQFKWSWLDCFFRRIPPCDMLKEILKQIRQRKEKEYSVLRRIVEGDDISYRHMVLLVVDAKPDKLELFDGYYSVACVPDDDLAMMISSRRIRAGMKLRVFGADLILNEPRDILELSENVLMLHYNGVRVAPISKRLGRQRSCSFLKRISELSKSGGTISCLDVTIERILDDKVLIKFGSVKTVIDSSDLERELEKIEETCRAEGVSLSASEFVLKRFVRMVVSDGSGSCVLTWWSPFEVRLSDRMRFTCLKIFNTYNGTHISTTNKTYARKL